MNDNPTAPHDDENRMSESDPELPRRRGSIRHDLTGCTRPRIVRTFRYMEGIQDTLVATLALEGAIEAVGRKRVDGDTIAYALSREMVRLERELRDDGQHHVADRMYTWPYHGRAGYVSICGVGEGDWFVDADEVMPELERKWGTLDRFFRLVYPHGADWRCVSCFASEPPSIPYGRCRACGESLIRISFVEHDADMTEALANVRAIWRQARLLPSDDFLEILPWFDAKRRLA